MESSEYRVNMENHHYNDCYFSSTNGFEESMHVFIEGNTLHERLVNEKSIHIGETGFGTGLNLLCLIQSIQNTEKGSMRVEFSSLEKYPLPTERIRELLSPFGTRLERNLELYLGHWSRFFQEIQPGWNRSLWKFTNVEVDFNLFNGDALEWCSDPLPRGVDAWFLDGHSPEKNPEIWSTEIMKSVYSKTSPGGTLASFTASGQVKRPLREAGFFIKRKKGYGTKRHMIQGIKT